MDGQTDWPILMKSADLSEDVVREKSSDRSSDSDGISDSQYTPDSERSRIPIWLGRQEEEDETKRKVDFRKVAICTNDKKWHDLIQHQS